MKPKISVIVPIYKVEPYLRQCIDSILAQTYTNLEIVLVDDGSPDSCGKICDEYAEKDNRIKVIHKSNGGVSNARNVGIDIATGEYLSFIDGDDWISSDMLDTLYSNLIKYDADISVCNYYKSYANDVNVPLYNVEEVFCLNSEKAIAQSFIGKKFPVAPWAKLYKKYIFDDIRYPIEILYGEDAFAIVDIFAKVGKIAIYTTPKYYYRQRKSSAIRGTSKIFQPKVMHESKVFERNLKVIEEKYPDIVDVAKARLHVAQIGVLMKMVFSENFRKIPEYKNLLSTLRKNFWFIMKSEHITKNDKIKAIALKINVMLFKWVYIIYYRLEKIRGNAMFE